MYIGNCIYNYTYYIQIIMLSRHVFVYAHLPNTFRLHVQKNTYKLNYTYYTAHIQAQFVYKGLETVSVSL